MKNIISQFKKKRINGFWRFIIIIFIIVLIIGILIKTFLPDLFSPKI